MFCTFPSKSAHFCPIFDHFFLAYFTQTIRAEPPTPTEIPSMAYQFSIKSAGRSEAEVPSKAEGSKKINQICSALKGKIEKSKKILSPFLTTS